MMETAVSAEDPKAETRSRIRQLVTILNRSTSQFLDAEVLATRPWDPETEELAALTTEKLMAARELLDLLDRIRTQ